MLLEKDFIGKKVYVKSGESFAVVACVKSSLPVDGKTQRLDDFRITLVNDITYSVRSGLLSGKIKFDDDQFQNLVQNELLKKQQPEPWYTKIIKEAIELYRIKGNKKSPCSTFGAVSSGLKINTAYGTKALDIYTTCCKFFGWNYSKRHFFDLKQILFATNATSEGYAAWMLPNNSWTGQTSGAWANVFEKDKIHEVWFENKVGTTEKRVTFAKQGNGEYVFIGVYEIEKVEKIDKLFDGIKIHYIKTYKRISDKYPIM